jgi:hypothetical protein
MSARGGSTSLSTNLRVLIRAVRAHIRIAAAVTPGGHVRCAQLAIAPHVPMARTRVQPATPPNSCPSTQARVSRSAVRSSFRPQSANARHVPSRTATLAVLLEQRVCHVGVTSTSLRIKHRASTRLPSAVQVSEGRGPEKPVGSARPATTAARRAQQQTNVKCARATIIFPWTRKYARRHAHLVRTARGQHRDGSASRAP